MAEEENKSKRGLLLAIVTIMAGIVATFFKDDLVTMFSGGQPATQFQISQEFVVLTNQVHQLSGVGTNGLVTYTPEHVYVRGIIEEESILRYCVRLAWPTEPGKTYMLETRIHIDAPWEQLPVRWVGDGATREWYHNGVETMRQWRLQTL